jgi:pimeloyl-ACP methyl ester carboxylesterase
MGGAFTYASNRRDLDRANERIEAGSMTLSTPCGTTEYAERGAGPPILVVHGAGGGFDLERVRAPTLIVSAEDDRYGTYERARYTAAEIAGARFVGYPTGGHLLVGRNAEVKSEVVRFLARNGWTSGEDP